MERSIQRPRPLLAALSVVAGLLGGCASTSSTQATGSNATASNEAISDPLEGMNRFIFSINLAGDKLVLRPAAELYRFAVPRVGRDMVRNFLDNLETPVILANDLFQGEFERAVTTSSRFVINTTLGFAGVADPATNMGFVRHEEDFGQTLGSYGVGPGPYLMLPIFGPSNLRDAGGKVVDHFLDPVNQYAHNTDRDYLTLVRSGMSAVDSRERAIETLDDIERSSIDFYATIRSLYLQRRAADIRNGEAPAFPDIDMTDEPPKSATTAMKSE